MIRFHPLEHLHPLEYRRPDQTVMHIAGSTIDLRSCNTTLEYAEVDCDNSFTSPFYCPWKHISTWSCDS